MNRNGYYSTIGSFVFLLMAVHAIAQSKTTVKATVNKNRILIGERIKLTLEASIPENEPIRFFVIDTLPHFEIDKQKIDTAYTTEGTSLKQVVNVTSFDSGHWVIPQLPFSETLLTDSIPVDVAFSPMDSTQPYHDIKDIIEVKPSIEEKKWWIWYVVGGSLVLLAVILYFVLKKKKPAPVTVAAPVNPYDDAMKQLEMIQAQRSPAKQYYSGITDIFRLYVQRKKDIHSLQKTTDDLVIQLRLLPIPKEQFEKLSQALRLSDFVKFAKYVPSPEDDQAFFESIKSTITAIEQVTENPSRPS